MDQAAPTPTRASRADEYAKAVNSADGLRPESWSVPYTSGRSIVFSVTEKGHIGVRLGYLVESDNDDSPGVAHIQNDFEPKHIDRLIAWFKENFTEGTPFSAITEPRLREAVFNALRSYSDSHGYVKPYAKITDIYSDIAKELNLCPKT